ncbi:hypothetical protein COW64_21625 [bacterium (Candidatus Blackallbacteria) CG18_big_fil_WC_8_21_14_2_50_49_26]|nr:MAG: hypothetical protein COW64_21625 [bacterium (Candidatus Blackallbacteria) CG18_big_fil_WC_8_21_14_2_50_49_26]
MKLPPSHYESIRDHTFEWNCYDVVIWQDCADGHRFEGHGIIKSNQQGLLFLDFVCMKSRKQVIFSEIIPLDRFDEKQIVKFKAKIIGGVEITSENIIVKPSFQNIFSCPTLYRIGFNNIVINEFSRNEDANSIYFEFKECCDIPFNKNNKIESTLGSSSFSWNQTILENENFSFNLINHDNYTEVTISSAKFSHDELLDAVIFYIGFSSGSFPQPYLLRKTKKNNMQTIVRSVNENLSHKSVSPPLYSHVHDEENTPLDNLHFELLENIFKNILVNKSIFTSAYSQWKRVWHSFQAVEPSVAMLTLSVAVEGLLNDVYIPAIKRLSQDSDFEKEKLKIVDTLSSLNEINEGHKKSLCEFVYRWGNIYAKKALDYLESKKVIEAEHKKVWVELRNASAHPKLLGENETRKRKQSYQIRMCLGLFYRLILNMHQYKGAQYNFAITKDAEYDVLPFIDIVGKSN